jgi:hypothetical protein
VDGAGDGDALALAAGEGADALFEVVEDDAHVAQFLVGGAFHRLDVEAPYGPGALGDLGAEEEVAPDGHEGDGGEVLVDGGDATVEGLARGGEAHGFAVDEEVALGVPVQPRDDLDEGGLAGAVVAQHAGDLAGVHGEVHAVQGADVAVGLARAAQFDQGSVRAGRSRVGEDGTVAAGGVVVGHEGHLRVAVRWTHRLIRTAPRSMTPRKALNQSGFQPA